MAEESRAGAITPGGVVFVLAVGCGMVVWAATREVGSERPAPAPRICFAYLPSMAVDGAAEATEVPVFTTALALSRSLQATEDGDRDALLQTAALATLVAPGTRMTVLGEGLASLHVSYSGGVGYIHPVVCHAAAPVH